MNATLTKGFEVLRDVLRPEEVATLRGAVGDSIDRVARVMLTPFEQSRPEAVLEERLDRVAQQDRAYAAALLQVVMADAQRDPRLQALARHPGLAAAIAPLIAPHRACGEVIRTRAALPSFTSRISPWHQDVPRPEAPTGCATVRLACWIPLADVDERSGALEVMPGRWEAPLRHDVRDDGHFFIPDDSLPTTAGEVVPVRAGDVLVLDRFVPHRSRPTHDLQGRWAVVMWVKAGAAVAC